MDEKHTGTLAQPTRPSRSRILTEFAFFAGLLVLEGQIRVVTLVPWGSHQISFINLQSSPVALAIYAVILLIFSGSTHLLNFRWPRNWKRCLWHLALALGGLFVVGEIVGRLIHWLWGKAPEAQAMVSIFSQPEFRLLFGGIIFPVFAVAEEIFYRAYLLQRIEQLAYPWQHALPLAAGASALVFALGHLQYGLGEFPYFVFAGLVYAAIFLYTGRSIWFVSVVHYLKNIALLVWSILAA